MFDKEEFLNALLKRLQEETKQPITEKGKEIGALIRSIGLQTQKDEFELISELNMLTGIGIPTPIDIYSSKFLTVILERTNNHPNHSKEYIMENIGVMLGNRNLLRTNGNVTGLYSQYSLSLATEIDIINFVNYFKTTRLTTRTSTSNIINAYLKELKDKK